MGAVKVFCFLSLLIFLLLPPVAAQAATSPCFSNTTFDAIAAFPALSGKAEDFWIEFKFDGDGNFSSEDLCDILKSCADPACFAGNNPENGLPFDCETNPPQWVTKIKSSSFSAVLVCPKSENPRCSIRITGTVLEGGTDTAECRGMLGVIRVSRLCNIGNPDGGPPCNVLPFSGKSGRYTGRVE